MVRVTLMWYYSQSICVDFVTLIDLNQAQKCAENIKCNFICVSCFWWPNMRLKCFKWWIKAPSNISFKVMNHPWWYLSSCVVQPCNYTWILISDNSAILRTTFNENASYIQCQRFYNSHFPQYLYMETMVWLRLGNKNIWPSHPDCLPCYILYRVHCMYFLHWYWMLAVEVQNCPESNS